MFNLYNISILMFVEYIEKQHIFLESTFLTEEIDVFFVSYFWKRKGKKLLSSGPRTIKLEWNFSKKERQVGLLSSSPSSSRKLQTPITAAAAAAATTDKGETETPGSRGRGKSELSS